MTRRPTVIAGNWKMNGDPDSTRTLLEGILGGLRAGDASGVEIIVSPPFTSLHVASEMLSGSSIRLAAQNMSDHDDGAYTGEVSWRMLKAAGCQYVILGHSERRQYFLESDALVNTKVKKAFEKGMTPIMCIGETLEEREAGVTGTVISKQVKGGIAGLAENDVGRIIIAYEPVWAIGTGRTATPKQVQEVHAQIRQLIADSCGESVAKGVAIQYGGSVKPENATELLALPDVDGALVGGASLKADSFLAIIRASPA